MKRWIGITLLAFLVAAPLALAGDKDAAEAAERRAKVDRVAKESLERLFAEHPGAQGLFEKSHGYAAFQSVKVAVGISGGGGSGVAVNRKTDARTYMKMGTAGVGFGLGGRKYRVVFLFETEQAFNSFVDKGWKADASASATAGTDGAGVASTFHDGLAIFMLTDKGLMAAAEVAGTKFWKNDKLN